MIAAPSIASKVERQVSALSEGQAFVIFTEGKSEAMTVNLKAGGAKAAATRKRRATVKKTTDTK